MSDKLTTTLQESLLTLLATNDKEGRVASGLVTPIIFDDIYSDVARRILEYRKKYGKAPGSEHLDDLVDEIVADSSHKKHRQYIRILEGILSNATRINAPYILSRTNEFVKKQRLKAAILQAGELYQLGKEDSLTNVEDVLRKALRPRAEGLDVGIFLNNRRKIFDMLEKQNTNYLCGIEDFDRRDLGPTPGQMLILMAAKGKGKSWWAIDLGKRCLMQGARVAHISLEMSEELVVKRYFQNFFVIGKRSEPFTVSDFIFDAGGRLEGFKTSRRKVKMSLNSPKLKSYLNNKLNTWGAKLGNLVVKAFPAKNLTVMQLEAYLDMLEMQFNFIPNVLIVDYPDLMYMDKKDPRISLGWTIEELRGLLQKRNLAGVCPTQTNRSGWDATTVKGSMVAEDASKFRTADMVLIYSRTEQEKNRGLARLYVEKNRNDEDGFSVVITQNYLTGQFLLNSARMTSTYFDIIKPPTENGNGDSYE